MKKTTIQYKKFGNDTKEINICITPNENASFNEQITWIKEAYNKTLNKLKLNMKSAIICRFFYSDISNQQKITEKKFKVLISNCTCSHIGQMPIAPAKIALHAYHISSKKSKKTIKGQTVCLSNTEQKHYWTTNLKNTSFKNSEKQTNAIFNEYDNSLKIKLSEELIRTWIYVRDIDNNYQGMVDSRRKLFKKHNLNAKTHYIASTGIEAKNYETNALVSMDAYSIANVKKEQIQFIEALDNLCPTKDYGVTFERATSVSYRDRKHIFISGTASIDKKGNILHEGNIEKQLKRTLENIEALLINADANLSDMSYFLVYLRDFHDSVKVEAVLNKQFPKTPKIIIQGSVCRPGWLIEIEGIAIKKHNNKMLPKF